ncbi:MAG: hypothetical protein RL347_2297 [Actinomycetota bacterium]
MIPPHGRNLSSHGRRARALAAIASAGLAGVLLTGCGAVNEAVSQGQQALDTASQAVDAAEGLIGAGAQLGAACAAAQVAWVPGVSTADAYAAIDEATRLVDEALAATPGLPGAAEIDQALTAARDAVGSDQTEFGVARETLQTACALVSMGG